MNKNPKKLTYRIFLIMASFLFTHDMLTALDLGDHSSSTITGKAWNANGSGNHDLAIEYAKKCIEMYQTQALEQQSSLTAKAPKETAHDYWALNDVGTCYFIMGLSYEAKGNNAEALNAFRYLQDNLSFSQCWDVNGWFWGPADAAKKKVMTLEFDI